MKKNSPEYVDRKVNGLSWRKNFGQAL